MIVASREIGTQVMAELYIYIYKSINETTKRMFKDTLM